MFHKVVNYFTNKANKKEENKEELQNISQETSDSKEVDINCQEFDSVYHSISKQYKLNNKYDKYSKDNYMNEYKQLKIKAHSASIKISELIDDTNLSNCNSEQSINKDNSFTINRSHSSNNNINHIKHLSSMDDILLIRLRQTLDPYDMYLQSSTITKNIRDRANSTNTAYMTSTFTSNDVNCLIYTISIILLSYFEFTPISTVNTNHISKEKSSTNSKQSKSNNTKYPLDLTCQTSLSPVRSITESLTPPHSPSYIPTEGPLNINISPLSPSLPLPVSNYHSPILSPPESPNHVHVTQSYTDLYNTTMKNNSHLVIPSTVSKDDSSSIQERSNGTTEYSSTKPSMIKQKDSGFFQSDSPLLNNILQQSLEKAEYIDNVLVHYINLPKSNPNKKTMDSSINTTSIHSYDIHDNEQESIHVVSKDSSIYRDSSLSIQPSSSSLTLSTQSFTSLSKFNLFNTMNMNKRHSSTTSRESDVLQDTTLTSNYVSNCENTLSNPISLMNTDSHKDFDSISNPNKNPKNILNSSINPYINPNLLTIKNSTILNSHSLHNAISDFKQNQNTMSMNMNMNMNTNHNEDIYDSKDIIHVAPSPLMQFHLNINKYRKESQESQNTSCLLIENTNTITDNNEDLSVNIKDNGSFVPLASSESEQTQDSFNSNYISNMYSSVPSIPITNTVLQYTVDPNYSNTILDDYSISSLSPLNPNFSSFITPASDRLSDIELPPSYTDTLDMNNTINYEDKKCCSLQDLDSNEESCNSSHQECSSSLSPLSHPSQDLTTKTNTNNNQSEQDIMMKNTSNLNIRKYQLQIQEKYKKNHMKLLLSLFDVDLIPPQPTLRVMIQFITDIYNKYMKVPEILIISIIYIERFIDSTDETFYLTSKNWKNILLISYILSIKIWNDKYPKSLLRDFADTVGVPIEKFEVLETTFLQIIDYRLYIATSVYSQYLFKLYVVRGKLGLPQTAVNCSIDEFLKVIIKSVHYEKQLSQDMKNRNQRSQSDYEVRYESSTNLNSKTGSSIQTKETKNQGKQVLTTEDIKTQSTTCVQSHENQIKSPIDIDLPIEF